MRAPATSLVRALGPLVLASIMSGACNPQPADSSRADRVAILRAERLPAPFDRLRGEPMPSPGPSDWLATHDEAGQSLAEFLAGPRRKVGIDGRDIALTRLGTGGPAEGRIFARTGAYLEACYSLPVRFVPDIDPARIPSSARRAARGHGPQVNSVFVLDSLLVPAHPRDALVFLALSTLDLYPRDEWNFVFGQARPAKGVGVWSLARYGTPGKSSGEEAIVLSRMVRTATHETGHLLGLAHCITWRCVMNGSNHLDELDARPLEFCPACLAKVCVGLDVDPVARSGRAAEALEGFGLASDAARARAVGAALRGLASEP